MDIIVLVVDVCLLVIVMVVGTVLVIGFYFEPVGYPIRKFMPMKGTLICSSSSSNNSRFEQYSHCYMCDC